MIEDDLCCLYLYMLFLWQTYYTYTTMLCGLVEMFSINHYDFLKVTEFGTFFYISILHSRSWFLFMYQWHASAQIFPNGVFFWEWQQSFSVSPLRYLLTLLCWSNRHLSISPSMIRNIEEFCRLLKLFLSRVEGVPKVWFRWKIELSDVF